MLNVCNPINKTSPQFQNRTIFYRSVWVVVFERLGGARKMYVPFCRSLVLIHPI